MPINIPSSGWTSSQIAYFNQWARGIENQQAAQNASVMQALQNTLPPVQGTPGGVIGLAAVAPTATSVHLTWNAANVPLQGYKVYRASRNAFTSASPIGTAAAVTNAPGNFTDPTVAESTTYYYWVTAVAQQTNKESAAGSSTSVTTPAS